ncbi:MAG: peptide/nickel transport system permease protein [Acidimicrobiaceae bacterium]|nr:peptide/nickel transport system permease protein [Acidimicrobiaceae bacterium]
MPEPQPDPASADVEHGSTGRRRLGLLFWASVGWLGLIATLAATADWLPIPDPTRPGVAPARQPPTLHHLLGVDVLGRDMLSRTIHGARVSLVVGFSSIAFGLLVGGAVGVLAGYFRGRFEAIAMGTVDVLLAFPALVFALALVSFLGPSLGTVTLAIGVLSIAPIARIIRASTLAFAQREFVLAARTVGARHRRIIVNEILPNVIPAAVSFALVAVAVAIVSEGALAFLGLSVAAPTPTWGSMINEGRTVLQDAPHISFVPSAAMFLTVLALNFAGDSLRARFDVGEGRL